MERGERWLSLAIFFSFLGDKIRGRCDSHESHLPLIKTIYFPIAPFSDFLYEICFTIYIISIAIESHSTSS